MLNIKDSLSGAAAKRYFQDQLSAADYFLEDEQVIGRWRGLGAARLQLHGSVGRDAFFALIDNTTPDGDKLTARTKASRRPGTDFTFTAPKSVSLLYEIGGDDRVRAAFEMACDETLDEIERDIRTRVRKRGAFTDRVTGEGIWACFTHRTARPVDGVPDPHLHVHAYLINATYDGQERSWKAAEIGPVKRDALYYEAAFHARLAHKLVHLGYPIERKGQVFDVLGVSEPLMRRFSRREAEVSSAASSMGLEGRAAQKLSTTTRSAKGKGERISTLQALWATRLSFKERLGLDGLVRRARLGPARSERLSGLAAIAYARSHVFERLSIIDRSRLLAEALWRGCGSVLPEAVQSAADNSDALLFRTLGGRRIVTDKAMLALEQELLTRAREGVGKCRRLGDGDGLDLPVFLNDNQKAVIKRVLASRDQVVVLRGGAGTGKTTVLQAIAQGIQADGKPIVAVAPTASASREVLRREGFSGAETVAKLLVDKGLQRKLQNGVLLVDEAGLLSVRDLLSVLQLADTHDCRVLLIGDSKQHSSVAAGDALRLTTRYALEPAELTEIVRQRGGYKDAVAAVERGDVERGFQRLFELGALHEIAGEKRLELAADAYLDSVNAGRKALLVSPTHREKDVLTARIRDALRLTGRLAKTEHKKCQLIDLRFTDAERCDPASYAPDQVVLFRQHTKGVPIRRGERVRVVRVSGDGEVIVRRHDQSEWVLPLDQSRKFSVYAQGAISLSRGDRIRITVNGTSADGRRLSNGAVYGVKGFARNGDILLDTGAKLARDFGHIDYGYASTSHSAQGRTVDDVIIAMGRASTPASFYEQFYVTLSRGRSGVQLFTDDLDGVQAAVKQSRQRMSATELLGESQDKARSTAKATDQHVAKRMRWLKQEQGSLRGVGREPPVVQHHELGREGSYAQNEQAL